MPNSLQPHVLPTTPLHPWDFPGQNTGVGCHFLLREVFQTQGLNPCLLHWQANSLALSHSFSIDIVSRLISSTGSRILALADCKGFFNSWVYLCIASKTAVHVCMLSRLQLFGVDWSPPVSSIHGIFQTRNTEVGCHFLLQGIFLT